MKILVTGANGYLGRGIVRKLYEAGAEVVATGKQTDGIDADVEKIDADLFAVENPYTFFGKPDKLLHLAWKNGFVHYADSHIRELPKHYDFIKSMSKSEIDAMAIMGSMHEIGFYEGSIDENTSCNPESMYGIAKNALREISKIFVKQNDKCFQWLRGFYIVGNSSSGSSIFSKIAQSAQEGRHSFPFTMGENQFDFLDYDVFCDQVSAAVLQDKVNGIINICSGRPEKLSDRVERFIKENQYNIHLEYGAFPDRPYDSKAVWGNNKKIQEILEG